MVNLELFKISSDLKDKGGIKDLKAKNAKQKTNLIDMIDRHNIQKCIIVT